jgi:hypothetical protein
MSTKHRQTIRARPTLIGLALVIVVSALAAATPETCRWRIPNREPQGRADELHELA